MNIPPGQGMKDLARAAAVRRWPTHASTFARKCDDGRAEAALIAVAGLMRDAARRAAWFPPRSRPPLPRAPAGP